MNTNTTGKSTISFWKGRVESSLIINAPAKIVFQYLINRQNYPIGMVVKWTELQTELDHAFENNLSMERHIGTMPFPVSILTEDNVMNAKLWTWEVSDQTYKFGWKGKTGPDLCPLFTGTHTFKIENISDKNQCILSHSEDFGGLLYPIFMMYLKLSNFSQHFSDFNLIVKERLSGH